MSGVVPRPPSVSTEEPGICCQAGRGIAALCSPPPSLQPLGTHFSRDRPQGSRGRDRRALGPSAWKKPESVFLFTHLQRLPHTYSHTCALTHKHERTHICTWHTPLLPPAQRPGVAADLASTGWREPRWQTGLALPPLRRCCPSPAHHSPPPLPPPPPQGWLRAAVNSPVV